MFSLWLWLLLLTPLNACVENVAYNFEDIGVCRVFAVHIHFVISFDFRHYYCYKADLTLCDAHTSYIGYYGYRCCFPLIVSPPLCTRRIVLHEVALRAGKCHRVHCICSQTQTGFLCMFSRSLRMRRCENTQRMRVLF